MNGEFNSKYGQIGLCSLCAELHNGLVRELNADHTRLDLANLIIKQLLILDEVEHDIMNYQNRGLCYLPKPKAEADNTDTRF